MFQKVGINDVLIGLWNRKFRIIIVALLAVIVAIISIESSKNSNPEVKKAISKTTYTKFVNLYVVSEKQSDYIDKYDQSGKIRNIIVSTLNSEMFASYLEDNIDTEEPLGNYLIPIEDKKFATVLPDGNIKTICNSLKFDNGGDNSTLKISFNCIDDEIGDKIIDAAVAFVKEQIKNNFKGTEIKEFGRNSFETNQTYTFPIVQSNVLNESIKKAIVYGVLFEAAYCCIALAVIVFKPVINRKNDIEEYTDAKVWEV